MRRVVVTGLGAVTPLGTGVQHSWQSLISSKTAVKRLEGKAFDDLPCRVAAQVPYGSLQGEFDKTEWVTKQARATASPFIEFALSAATQALNDSGWRPKTCLEKQHTGVCIGSGIGCILEASKAAQALSERGVKRVSPYSIPKMLVNLAAGQVSMQHSLQGPVHCVSTACTTGAHSIGDGLRFIQRGEANAMLCGGTEASVHPLGIALFSRLRALSTRHSASFAISDEDWKTASRPFDAERDGFVMGEGAGVLMLEELGHALRRGAKIYAEVVGYGCSGDAHHVTAPAPDGRGAVLCMQAALKDAGVASNPDPLESCDAQHYTPTLEDVVYINAHATSTPIGDEIEARAIEQVFAKRDASRPLLVSSTKGSVGHMLGAAGAVESIFAVMSLFTGVVPPTLNLHKPGELSKKKEGHSIFEHVPHLSASLPPAEGLRRRISMSNSFGFGGTNASLVFAEWPQIWRDDPALAAKAAADRAEQELPARIRSLQQHLQEAITTSNMLSGEFERSD